MSDVLVLPSMDLLRLSDPRAKRKTVLKVKCFKKASLIGMNGAFVSWCNIQGEVPGGDACLTLWSISMETVQETSEILILADT